jgi:hypothetical protein
VLGSSWRCRAFLAGLIAASAAVAAPLAPAAEPPADVPGIAQYVETIPAATGSVQKGTSTTARSAKLSPVTRERLRLSGGRDAAALEEIASSPSLGAPPPARTAKSPTLLTGPTTEAGSSSPVVTADSDGHLTLLLVGLAVVSAAVAVARVYRKNDHR